MSLAQVKTAVEKFIENTRNDFLLIKGEWGVGKTYFWKDIIAKSSEADKVGHRHYAYISLFGIDSLESLKNSIIAARIDSNTSVKIAIRVSVTWLLK
jgi:chromosomal replication initiation ATPase DnaA